jgi:hypothetical protein
MQYKIFYVKYDSIIHCTHSDSENSLFSIYLLKIELGNRDISSEKENQDVLYVLL